MTQGTCRNAGCAIAASGTPVERYPGPGEFCPECGDLLEALEPSPPSAPPPSAPPPSAPQAPASQATTPAPFGGLTALEALARFDATPAPPPAQPRPRSRLPQRIAIAGVCAAVVAGTVAAVLRPTAAGHPPRSDVVRVCGSSMTERFAADVVDAYVHKTNLTASRFVLTRSAPCDVRFVARAVADDAAALGRDGIVVVVNPQNPLSRLTPGEVRQIFNGTITDWAEIGGPPGRIEPILPDDASDEAHTLLQTLFAGAASGSPAQRLASSGNVVRAVVGASGLRAIGLVAFSAAVPAKVLKLGSAPAPSTLSIGDRRYPLSVALVLESDAAPHGVAGGLARYARSEAVQTILARDGFVPKKGF